MITTYTVGEAAKRIGRCVKTLQRWDRVGVLTARRTITGRRYYTEDQIQLALGMPEAPEDLK